MIGSDAFEKIFYLYTRENPKYLSTVSDSFYENKQISVLHSITKQFYERFSQMPSESQLKTLAKQDKFKTQISESIINIVFDEKLDEYDPDWLKETCESWVLWKSLDKSLVDTIEYVKTVQVNPNNVKDIINKVKTLINDRNSISFSSDLGSDFFEVTSHINKPENKFSSCHNWIDQFTGGYSTKNLVVYAGQPNVGKSVFLANEAVNFTKAGHNVAVISAEMDEIKYTQRIGANLLDIKIDEYDKFAKKPDVLKNKLSNISNGIIPPGRLFIKEVPTSQATVLDVENYLRELETAKGVKLKVVIIDYINILSNYRNPNSENTYMKIKQISEDLRGMAIRNNWLIITATQFGKQGWESTDVTMGDIAESAGLSHTADILLGIIQTSEMHMKNEYWVKILKIRNGGGKNMKCKYDIQYPYMRLIETDEVVFSDVA